MRRIYVIVSLLLFAAFAPVHGRVCLNDYCAAINCTGIKRSSCTDNQVFMPYTGFCGCCPGCVKKIHKGEKCAGLLELMGSPNTRGCEENTTCKKYVEGSLVCD